MQLVKYRYTRVNQQAANRVNTVLVRVFSFKKVVKLVYGEGEHKLDWAWMVPEDARRIRAASVRRHQSMSAGRIFQLFTTRPSTVGALSPK